MLQDVAVIHEGMLARCRLIEGDEQFGLVFDEHRVLPARKMGAGGAPSIDKMRNNAPWT